MYTLNNQLSIPSIGFGTWKILELDAAVLAISTAVECGYRLIDTASVYENESIIGTAIAKSGISREALFISGKVWNTDRGYDKTLAAFDASCKKLNTDYMDCYLIHWPASPFFSEDWEAENADTWRALEHLYHSGFVKSIGVCNYAPAHLTALSKTANEKPMIDQIEFHPGACSPDIYEYCLQEQIQIQAWSPLGNGELLSHPALCEIANGYQAAPAHICLKWCRQKGAIPLPKSVTPERIRANISLPDFEISPRDMDRLDSLDLKRKG